MVIASRINFFITTVVERIEGFGTHDGSLFILGDPSPISPTSLRSRLRPAPTTLPFETPNNRAVFLFPQSLYVFSLSSPHPLPFPLLDNPLRTSFLFSSQRASPPLAVRLRLLCEMRFPAICPPLFPPEVDFFSIDGASFGKIGPFFGFSLNLPSVSAPITMPRSKGGTFPLPRILLLRPFQITRRKTHEVEFVFSGPLCEDPCLLLLSFPWSPLLAFFWTPPPNPVSKIPGASYAVKHSRSF